MGDRAKTIRDRWKKSSSAPWTRVTDPGGGHAVHARTGPVCQGLHAADAEAIAHAPTDIAWLLDEVQHLRQTNAQLRSRLGIREEEVGTSREGDITLARFKIERPSDD